MLKKPWCAWLPSISASMRDIFSAKRGSLQTLQPLRWCTGSSKSCIEGAGNIVGGAGVKKSRRPTSSNARWRNTAPGNPPLPLCKQQELRKRQQVLVGQHLTTHIPGHCTICGFAAAYHTLSKNTSRMHSNATNFRSSTSEPCQTLPAHAPLSIVSKNWDRKRHYSVFCNDVGIPRVGWTRVASLRVVVSLKSGAERIARRTFRISHHSSQFQTTPNVGGTCPLA